jgi:hypothetical protein
MAGGGSQPINSLKKFKQTGKLPKFTKPFCCLSIPTARLRINMFVHVFEPFLAS